MKTSTAFDTSLPHVRDFYDVPLKVDDVVICKRALKIGRIFSIPSMYVGRLTIVVAPSETSNSGRTKYTLPDLIHYSDDQTTRDTFIRHMSVLRGDNGYRLLHSAWSNLIRLDSNEYDLSTPFDEDRIASIIEQQRLLHGE